MGGNRPDPPKSGAGGVAIRAAVLEPVQRAQLCHWGELGGLAELPALVVHAEHGHGLGPRLVVGLVCHGRIQRQLRIPAPALVGAEAAELVGAEQQVGAAAADLGVRIEVRVRRVAVRQLQARGQPDGHVFRQARVGDAQARIAQRAVRMADDLPRVRVRRAEIALPVRQVDRHAPRAIEEILAAQRVEARADALVLVVVRRGGRGAVAVLVLVHEVVFGVHHAARMAGIHGAGADIEDAAAAGTGHGIGREQRGGKARGQRGQGFHGCHPGSG